MPTKPNMRMGGVDTQGDRGVMASAMSAAQIKASAQDQSGLNSLSANVLDWADDVQKEDRQKRLEARAEGRGIAKEGRATAAEAEKRKTQLGYLEDETSPEAIKAKQVAGESSARIAKMKAETEYTKGGKSKTGSDKWSEDKKYDIKAVDSQIKDLDEMTLELDPKKDKKKLAIIANSKAQLNERKRFLRMSPAQQKKTLEELRLKKKEAEEAAQIELEAKAKESKILEEEAVQKEAERAVRLKRVEEADAKRKRVAPNRSSGVLGTPTRPANRFSSGGSINSSDIENVLRYK